MLDDNFLNNLEFHYIMSVKKPEILAPVGGLVMLKAAIDAKADAIYFGVKELNMRATAGNFEISQIKSVVKKCHDNNVKAYLTLNSIVYDDELEKLDKILNEAKKAKVDAVICHDMAVLSKALSFGIDIHISTQASVSNFESVKYYASLGVKRIVLARECTLKQIKLIKENIVKTKLKVEIEVFVHGAMCVAISGRCFMSQFLFCKSANRGDCLQPCRREYDVVDKETGDKLTIGNSYVLSPKDLCAINFVDKLIDAGIDSFKIEGRVKPPEYVKTTVTVYRKAIDAYFKGGYDQTLAKELEHDLLNVFNRDFSNGFYMGAPMNEFTNSYGGKTKTKKVYVGFVKNFYSKVGVAEIKLESSNIHIDKMIMIQGPTTGVVEDKILSMQINHRDVKHGEKGKSVAVKLSVKVRPNDKVFIIEGINN